jgi:hypothetical protein
MIGSLLIGLTLTVGQVNPATAGVPAFTNPPGGAKADALLAQAPAAKAPPEAMPAPAAPATPQAPDKTVTPPPILPDAKAEEKKEGENACKEDKEHVKKEGCFLKRMWGYYCDEFKPKKEEEAAAEEGPSKRWDALPEPWSSPPFPMHEFQGYPLPGVPREDERYPFMEAVYDGPWGEAIKASQVKFYGWITGSFTDSTANHLNPPGATVNHPANLNAPDSYWLVANRLNLDQIVFRLEREPDLAQSDHIDWGFRSTIFYGMDYRYTYAGGWASDQFQKHNLLYGWDPLENYIDIFIPQVIKGLDVRVGRWVACPDIETQLAPDNYLGSHSILFTYDTYTQTGIMLTQRLNQQWIVQAGINCGDDMAPWYKGATPCGYAGIRWVAKSNKDAVYTVLNQINDARFRNFTLYGVPEGHDNYNYEVTTWEHVFSKDIHTKTEAYYMWEHDAVLGGTPSVGPTGYGAGGGFAPINSYSTLTHFPFTTRAFGVLNYTMFAIGKDDFITFRNEVWKDASGFRAAFPGTYTDTTIGLTHNFNKLLQLRPEVGYYRNWNQAAFDSGNARGAWIAGADFTLRF